MFKASNNYKTIFTSSATIAINTFLKGYKFKEGMNVYITGLEHNSVIRTMNSILSKYYINIKEIFIKHYNLMYNIKEMDQQFKESPPDMIILNHASNVFGLIAPIEEIFKLGKKYGSVNILDASQTSGMLNIDLKNMSVDCVIFSGHKSLYAPFGIAGMVLNTNINLEPLVHGGTGINSSDLEMPLFYPERLEAGSIDIYALAGLNAALKWIQGIGINNIYAKEKKLLEYTAESLKELNNIRCYIPSGEQIAILSFNVYGYSPDETSMVLSRNNIAVRSGLHCCPGAHKLLNTFPGGTVRIGLGYFNKEEDIVNLLSVIKTM